MLDSVCLEATGWRALQRWLTLLGNLKFLCPLLLRQLNSNGQCLARDYPCHPGPHILGAFPGMPGRWFSWFYSYRFPSKITTNTVYV